MENIPRLYNTCLRRISLLLNEGIWNSSNGKNPFSDLPKKINDHLLCTAVKIQQTSVFSANHLKLLLTSGKLTEFKVDHCICICFKFWSKNWSSDQNLRGFRTLEREIAQALKFLASASQNLEVFEVSFANREKASEEISNALQELLQNSPKLKYIHCKIPFKLNVLRNCAEIKSIRLHFCPEEPWYDFLEEDNENEGSYRTLNSLETFTICGTPIELPGEVFSKYIVNLLRHCPSLTSLGRLDTSRALAQLHRQGHSIPIKLQQCHWENDECVQDAVKYHPGVEELEVITRSIENIESLRNLKNLVFLTLWITVDRDISTLIDTVLNDIGFQLKCLSLWLFERSVDLSILLKNCPNLEALQFSVYRNQGYSETTISLPNLKYFCLTGISGEEQELLRLFSGCHSLTELFMEGRGFDDETLDVFLKRNSLTNLKIAHFEGCDLTKQGFAKFLLNAPNLEKVFQIRFHGRTENNLKAALYETNHKADNTEFCVTNKDNFFNQHFACNLWF